MNLLKKELLSHKNLLLKYKTVIPNPQLPKFEKDMETMFQNYEKIEEQAQLDQILKLAKNKFKALKKIYGDLSEEKNKHKVEIFDENSAKIIEDLTNELKIEEETYPNFKEISSLPGFNPILVKKFREEYNRASKEYHEKLISEIEKRTNTKFTSKTEEELYNDPNIKKQMNDIELENMRDYFNQVGSSHKDKDGNPLTLTDEALQEILERSNSQKDIIEKKALDKMELERIEHEQKNSNLKETDDLFKGSIKNNVHIELTEEQQKLLDEQLDKVLSDKSLSDVQKSQKCFKIINDTENEILKSQCDGEVSFDKYGNLEFKVYVEEEASSDGIKTYVFRDGKLVEGKAKKREVVVYSNWHSGNMNPDELKKHKALLDRQHFRGPLWEGIGRPQSIIDDPNILMYQHLHKPNSDDVTVDKLKPGKQSWEELER